MVVKNRLLKGKKVFFILEIFLMEALIEIDIYNFWKNFTLKKEILV